ncbi:unnamed protein product [Ophioblennius macclurei]
MKTTAVVLLCLVAAAVFTTVLCQGLEPGPKNCCFDYYPKRISKKYIRTYFVTESRCLKPGIILITAKSNKQICVNPNETWVQNLTTALDKESF